MLDWLFPQTIETFQSKFNGEVRVVKSFGKLSVVVGGYQQSGPMIERVWREALLNKKSEIKDKKYREKIKQVLILGLGMGTIIPILREQYPNIQKIIGVEIDPVMVEIGRKYFALNSYLGLNIEINDAKISLKRFIEQKKRFGLVIVDIYKGNVIDGRMNLKFIESCRNLLKLGGMLVVNVLEFGPKAVEAKKLVEKLRLEPGVEIKKVDYNHFAFVTSGKMV